MARKYVTALHTPSVLGFRHGLRQPAQLLNLFCGELALNPPWSQIDIWLSKRLSVTITESYSMGVLAEHPPKASEAVAWCWRVLLTARALLSIGGIPIFDPGRLLRLFPDRNNPNLWNVEVAVAQVDYVADEWFRRAYEAAAIIVSGLAAHFDDFSDPEPLYRQLEVQLIGPMWSANSSSHSNMALLQAAYAADIPWRHQGHGLYQLGWGTHLRRFQNSQLDSDSLLGKKISGHKYVTAQWLRRAGLPTAHHLLVNMQSEAAEAAQSLGWPVVIKPASSVGGQGVTLNISTEAEVYTAFLHATKISPQVLVERQVEGCVHHVQVVNDKVLYVLRRSPVAVKGDGKHTVSELISFENTARQSVILWKRAPALTLDTVAIACIQRVGFSPLDIPPEGVWVPLRDIPTNIDGGRDDDMTSVIHPSNVVLALRAAKLLGLGLAGIDIISPDISIPWYINGAIINEVNNAPVLGLGPSSIAAMPSLLMQLVDSDGRIPVEVFVGDHNALLQGRQRQQALVSQGIECFLTNHEVTENPLGMLQPMTRTGAFFRTRALLMNNRVETIVLVLQTDEWLETGLPVDLISRLEVINDMLVSHNGMPIKSDDMSQLLIMLHQHLSGGGREMVRGLHV